jgi:hypothetical protein
MIERIKQHTYRQIYGNSFFWCTYAGQEIDLVQEREVKLFGYELKWSENKPTYPPQEWSKGYPGAEFAVTNPSNYLDFLLAE